MTHTNWQKNVEQAARRVGLATTTEEKVKVLDLASVAKDSARITEALAILTEALADVSAAIRALPRHDRNGEPVRTIDTDLNNGDRVTLTIMRGGALVIKTFAANVCGQPRYRLVRSTILPAVTVREWAESLREASAEGRENGASCA